MKGTVKNVIANKNFGFIRDPEGIEYFFHKEDYLGDWNDLELGLKLPGRKITVEYDGKPTSKGHRASNVRMV